MAAVDEKVYLGRDNSIDLILLADSSAVDMSGIVKIGLKIGKSYLTETTLTYTTGYIRWNQVGYDAGEVRLYLGLASSVLKPGRYSASLVVYDSVSTNGIVWDDELRIQIMSDPTTT